MKLSSRVRRWGFNAAAGAVLLIAAACVTGCSSATGTGSGPTFWTSGTPVAPNQIRLAAGGSAPDTLTLLVEIVGPTSADDLSAITFDLLLSDPTVADYVDGSATVGTALDPDGAGGVSVDVVHVEQRLSVTVRRPAGTGTGVTAGRATVLALRYRVRRSGTTAVQFAPDPAPRALDAAGGAVSSIAYDMAPSAIVGH